MTRKSALILTLAASALTLGACSTAVEAVRGPELAPIGYPAALVPTRQAYLPSPEEQAAARAAQNAAIANAPAASANSLWRTGARTFFGDQRARRIGDILTVSISIDDRAQTSNSTNRTRSNDASAGVSNFFGLESSLGRVLPGGFDPSNMVGLQGEANAAGSGSVSRSEKVELTIAAVVTDVMANGNLMIQGRQEVRTNREVRELTVAGIVRPEDISSANTINHTQIAEARISYGGRGDISRMQATPAAQALVERFSPF
jgi:flagellar L-ring protein precursor FlgH